MCVSPQSCLAINCPFLVKPLDHKLTAGAVESSHCHCGRLFHRFGIFYGREAAEPHGRRICQICEESSQRGKRDATTCRTRRRGAAVTGAEKWRPFLPRSYGRIFHQAASKARKAICSYINGGRGVVDPPYSLVDTVAISFPDFLFSRLTMYCNFG